MGTMMRRREKHIDVADWLFLAFVVTVAMPHVVDNLSIPVSIWGSRSVQVFASGQDAMPLGGTGTAPWASSWPRASWG